MGCDGGTIPKRDELVRTKKKPEQADRDAENIAKWKHCALTQEELKTPIVSCELGRLYNKESVIEHLLDKSKHNDLATHIRNLKDVVNISLTVNPTYKAGLAEKGDEYIDVQQSQYICPVTGLEMNGRHKFCYIRKCGCVLSERSLKEIKADCCHRCGVTYEEEDVIVINGSAEDVELLKQRMTIRREKAKADKKSKKDRKKHKLEAATGEASSSKSRKLTSSNDVKEGVGKGSMVNDSNARALMLSEEKLKADYSVAKDPRASEALKSIFTSHKSHKEQERAHWVTYNPLYN
ncbi:hypothetical protein CHUAL_006188 [Chamberlinius hualienensis]